MTNNTPQIVEEKIKEYLNLNDLNDLNVELSEEEFEKFNYFLEKLGLKLHDTWEGRIFYAEKHRRYYAVDEYEGEGGMEVHVHYTKIVWNDNTHYVINKIKIIKEN